MNAALICDDTYAAMADLALEKRLAAEWEKACEAELDALVAFTETEHGCWPTPDQLAIWEEAFPELDA